MEAVLGLIFPHISQRKKELFRSDPKVVYSGNGAEDVVQK